ncbi:hypothetical protein MASR1M60_29310 [Rhodocyclaceae bacterium]
MRQKELALKLGYEPSYISALERSEKGPPKQDFVQRLIRGLELTEDEQAELNSALIASRRQISLPAQASELEYELLHELEPQLGRLTPLQIQLFRLALRLPSSLSISDIGSGESWCHSSEEREAPKM